MRSAASTPHLVTGDAPTGKSCVSGRSLMCACSGTRIVYVLEVLSGVAPPSGVGGVVTGASEQDGSEASSGVDRAGGGNDAPTTSA